MRRESLAFLQELLSTPSPSGFEAPGQKVWCKYARTCAAVTIRMLETIATVATFAQQPVQVAALLCHAEMIVRGAREGLPEAEDLRVVEQRYQAARRLLGEPVSSQE